MIIYLHSNMHLTRVDVLNEVVVLCLINFNVIEKLRVIFKQTLAYVH